MNQLLRDIFYTVNVVRWTFFITIMQFLLISEVSARQVGFTEHFEDRNLTANPEWTGDLEDFNFFEAYGATLLGLDTESSPNRSQIRTASNVVFGSWELFIQVPATSNFNRTYIYLISDSEELDIVGSGSPSRTNGYAIHTGSGRFDLVRIVNGSQEEILISSDTSIDPGTGYEIRVTRSASSEWQLYLAEGYGSEPVREGESVIDDQFTHSEWFGIYTRYTSGNVTGTYIGAIRVTALHEDSENDSDGEEESDSEDESDSDREEAEEDSENEGEDGSDEEDETENDPDRDSGNEEGDGDSEEESESDSDEGGDNEDGSGDEGEGENDSDSDSEGDGNSDSDNDSDTDPTPFFVSDLELIRADQLLLEFSDTPDPDTVAPEAFLVVPGIGSPTEAELSDPQKILLTFPAPFPNGTFTLEIGSITSTSGQTFETGEPLQYSVENSFAFETANALSLTEIRVSFTEPFSSTSVGNSNFEIHLIESDRTLHPDLVSIEEGSENRALLLQLSEPLHSGEVEIWSDGLQTDSGWPLLSDKISFELTNNFKVIDFRFTGPNQVDLTLSERPQESLLTEAHLMIDEVYSPKNIEISENIDEWLLSIRYTPSFSSGVYFFDAGSLRSEFGWELQGEMEFQFEVNNPFSLTDFSVLSHSELQFAFSSDLDEATVEPSRFQFSGGFFPSTALLQESNLVVIRFDEPLKKGEYEVTVSGLKSSDGWRLEAEMPVTFTLYDLFEPGDLLITEFYYRVPVSWRTSEFDRPQYVEIYNRSEKSLNVRGFRLSGELFSPDQDLVIGSMEYLVVARGKPVFEQRFGVRNFFEAVAFPRYNLTTSGTITLETNEGIMADSLTYHSSSWGGNSVALERISMDHPAWLRGNWNPSLDPLTGSPGLPNTVTVPDEPPSLVRFSNPMPTILELEFSRDLSVESAELISNYSLGGEISITDVIYDENSRTVRLTTSRELSNGTLYRLEYSVSDLFGNWLNDAVEFEAENPFRVLSAELITDHTLRLTFTLPVDRSSVSVGSFELKDGTNPRSFEMPISTVIDLEFTDAFDSGKHQLSVEGLISFNPNLEEQWSIDEESITEFYRFDSYEEGDVMISEFMYRPRESGGRYVEVHNRSQKWLDLSSWRLERRPGAPQAGGVIGGDSPVVLAPGQWLVIAEDVGVLRSRYGEVSAVEMVRFPGFTVSQPDQIRLVSTQGERVDSLGYDPREWGGDGVSLERRSMDVASWHVENWGESIHPDGGTPGRSNSVGVAQDAARVDRVVVLDSTRVRVVFTRSLQSESVGASAFEWRPAVEGVGVAYSGGVYLDLLLEQGLVSGQQYELQVSGVRDLFGLEVLPWRGTLRYVDAQQAGPGDVVISEFMFRPGDGMTRYVELYNRSSKWLDLSGWSQANDTGRRRVLRGDAVHLGPGEYLVIAPDSTLMERFEGIRLVSNPSMPALKRGGDAIVLFNEQGVVVDSLRYSSDWGSEGVSLERRRMDLPGEYRENWGESPSPQGGTPGRANEVSRSFEFKVEWVQVTGQDRLEVGFSAQVDSSSLVLTGFVVGSSRVEGLHLVSPRVVQVQVEGGLRQGPGELQVSEVRSAAGFSMSEAPQRLPFMVFDAYEPGDVVISEFMYRPRESGGRYVEVHNRSQKWLDLSSWRLERRPGAPQAGGVIGGDSPVVLAPGQWLAIAEDVGVLRSRYGEVSAVEMVRFPGFTVSQPDQIRLVSTQGERVDSLGYDPREWGGDGVSLERRSMDVASWHVENWGESIHPDGGTPGMANSIGPDQTPLKLIRAEQYMEEGFLLTFNKPLETNSVLNHNHYRIEPEQPLQSIEADREQVLLRYHPLQNGQSYTLTVEGLSDLFGNRMEEASAEVLYLQFGEPNKMELVINEVLFRRENPDSPQFIEIYNPSDLNIKLDGWSLENSSGSELLPDGLILRPDSYLVLADRKDPERHSDGWITLPAFRSLRVTSDRVVIRNSDGIAIDSLSYTPSWHQNEPGVSIERKDPSAISIDPSNWRPSSHPEGSTPGEKNSRYRPDLDPPEILFATFAHPDTILVLFDKFIAMDPVPSKKKSPGKKPGATEGVPSPRFLINNREVSVLKFHPNRGNRVYLDASGVDSGRELSLVAEHLGDFQGNINPKINQPVAQPAEPGDLVINEILYQPLADPRDQRPDQSEYIEIYNRQPYALSLEGMFIHDEPDERGRIQRLEPVSTAFQWIPGNAYLVIYPEQEEIPFSESRTARFFGVREDSHSVALRVNRSTLGLTNTGRMVVLADSLYRVIDSVSYSPDWHNPNLIDTRGIALERISPDAGSNEPSNWSSSADPYGGTPGSRNTLFQVPERENDGVGVVLTPNPFSPFDPGFDDRLFIRYKLDEPDYLIRARIFDRHGRLVRTLTEGERAGFEGTLMWDGRTDSGGQNRMGIYIVLFEAFNSSSGRNRVYKETVVLARRF